MKILKGKLSIHRTTNGARDEDAITIRVTDESSGCEAIEVTVGMKEFSYALTGFAFQKCEFELNDSGVIGLNHEHKTEKVLVPDHAHKDREAAARKAIEPLEVDGWYGSDSSAMNSHNIVRDEKRAGGTTYGVHFHRFVDPETGFPWAKKGPAE